MECTKCNKKIDKLDVFPNNICLECYEVEYEKLTAEEKKPDFTKTLTV